MNDEHSTETTEPTTQPEEERELEKSPSHRFIKYDKEVGRGSFKTVYKALDTLTASPVAWLELQPHKLTKEDRNRFKSEAEILKKLKHPNIVQFYDSWEATLQGRSTKSIVFTTELMTSGTLKGYLRKFKVIRSKPLKSWSRQILLGLQYLHSRDPPILHRDLKCDNIFVTGQTGVVKIGDLGLATIKRHGGAAKSVIGTPEFMAPEMYEENYAEPVDVYAFGMCLMEMVTNEYPYEECKNATHIYRKVVAGELPHAFRKVEDDKIKNIIKSCIEPKPDDRISVQQLLENDFFEEKYLKVLDVGKTGSELKLRLVVNEPGVNNRRMPEDEAIDFTFHIGVDTALQVAQDMAKESTLNNADVALVARSIQTAVDKYKSDKIEKETSESKKPANAEFKIVPDAADPPKKDEKKTVAETQPVVAPTPATTAAPSEQPVASTEPAKVEKTEEEKKDEHSQVLQQSASKTNVETKKSGKKKGNHKKGISFTVVQIKKKENGTGWDVHVRITALDITTFSFSVEQLKFIDDTVKQLSNEVVKNNLITEAQREKAEELLKKLIKRLFEGQMGDGEIQPTRYPTQVSWKGCRRLEDGNMEIEVDVDSVRHVPSYPVKFTLPKIEHQVKSIKELGIIQEAEIVSVTNQFKAHWQTSVEKMDPNRQNTTKTEITDQSPDNTLEDKPKEQKEVEDEKKDEEKKDEKESEQETQSKPVEETPKAPPTNRFSIKPVKKETVAAAPIEPKEKPKMATIDGGTQTGDERDSSLDKPTGDSLQRSMKEKTEKPDQTPSIENKLKEKLAKEGIEVPPKPSDTQPQNQPQIAKSTQLIEKDSSTDVNESSMSDEAETHRGIRERDVLNRHFASQSAIIAEFSTQMAQIRAEIDKETELLAKTLTSINERNKEFFATWEAMLRKMNTKRKVKSSRPRTRNRTATIVTNNNASSGSGDEKQKKQDNAKMPPPPVPVSNSYYYPPHNPSPPGPSDNPSPPGGTAPQQVMPNVTQHQTSQHQQQWASWLPPAAAAAAAGMAAPHSTLITPMTGQVQGHITGQPQAQPPPQQAASVISEPDGRHRTNQVNSFIYNQNQGISHPPANHLNPLNSLLPPNMQRGMQEGYGADTAIHMAMLLLNRLSGQQQAAPMNNQLNLNGMGMNGINQLGDMGYYTQSIGQQQQQQQQQQTQQQMIRQQPPQEQNTGNAENRQQQQAAGQQQQTAQPGQMKPPQQAHSGMSLTQQQQLLQQQARQQVEPLSGGLTQMERDQRTQEWVQNNGLITEQQINQNQQITNGGDRGGDRGMNVGQTFGQLSNSMNGGLNTNLSQINQFQVQQQMHQMAQHQKAPPQQQPPPQQPNQPNPVMMTNPPQQNVPQMVGSHGNIITNAYHQPNEAQ